MMRKIVLLVAAFALVAVPASATPGKGKGQGQGNNGSHCKTLKRGFTTDVSPILAQARVGRGAAIDPVAAYRNSGYRAKCGQMRPGKQSLGGGIV